MTQKVQKIGGNRWGDIRAGAQGQALVEFILVIMLFLIIAFGILDFGRAFHVIIVITNSAREGVRFITLNPNDLNGGVAAAVNEANNAGVSVNSSQVSVSCTDVDSNGCDSGFAAVVSISYQFETVLGNLFSASPVTFTRQAQMVVP